MRKATHGYYTLEMALLLIAVVAAILGMQIYVKRGLAGRLRLAAESLGDPYVPGRTTSFEVTTLQSNREETVIELGNGSVESRALLTSSNSSDVTSRTINETITDEPTTDIFNR